MRELRVYGRATVKGSVHRVVWIVVAAELENSHPLGKRHWRAFSVNFTTTVEKNKKEVPIGASTDAHNSSQISTRKCRLFAVNAQINR